MSCVSKITQMTIPCLLLPCMCLSSAVGVGTGASAGHVGVRLEGDELDPVGREWWDGEERQVRGDGLVRGRTQHATSHSEHWGLWRTLGRGGLLARRHVLHRHARGNTRDRCPTRIVSWRARAATTPSPNHPSPTHPLGDTCPYFREYVNITYSSDVTGDLQWPNFNKTEKQNRDNTSTFLFKFRSRYYLQ